MLGESLVYCVLWHNKKKNGFVTHAGLSTKVFILHSDFTLSVSFETTGCTIRKHFCLLAIFLALSLFLVKSLSISLAFYIFKALHKYWYLN